MSFYQEWLASVLFWLGLCIAAFGLVLLLFPAYAVQLGHRMNRWVSTDAFFQLLDRPHYRERLVYRWHRLFGVLVVFASLYIIYVFGFRTDVDVLVRAMPLFREKIINQWLIDALIYFFLGASCLTCGLGLLISIRPSLLKRLEQGANAWIGLDKSLDKLNNRYEIPENILPGNVRLFGTFVLLGGLYIMFATFRFAASTF